MRSKPIAKALTPQWFEARRKLVTATDTPVLFGMNPFKDADKLLEYKLGPAPPTNRHMQRGIEQQPHILRMFAQGRPYRELHWLYRSERYPWLAASPDGVIRHNGGSALVEIKCPSKVRARSETFHVWQVYHQLIVCGLTHGFVVYGNPTKTSDIYVAEVHLRPWVKDTILDRTKEFYDNNMCAELATGA